MNNGHGVSKKGTLLLQNAHLMGMIMMIMNLWILGTHSALGQTHMKPLRTGLDGRSLHLSLVVDDDSCVVLATVIWLGVKTKLGPHRVHAENWV